MYTYEELLRLSGFKERKGEKEEFCKRWKKMSESTTEGGEKEEYRTYLRDDKVMPSLGNAEALKNVKASKDGFIEVSEDYYER